MKTKITLLILLATVLSHSYAQRFSEKITKELSFEKPGNNTVMVFNVNGNVNVTGYAGDKVLVEVQRVITGKTDRRLEIGKAQISLGIKDLADTVILYTEGLCNGFGKFTRGNNHNAKTNGWEYDWNYNRNKERRNCPEEEFEYQMNYTIKVPAGVNLFVSTINDGDLRVENVSGSVRANNINGSIALKNISGATNASTINGSVDLDYVKNPPEECRYYSLNGDINANFRKGLTAMVSFESFNGALYTNLDPVEALPVLVEKVPAEKGIKYKIVGNRYKINKGGVLLDFETFNGNVYLKETLN